MKTFTTSGTCARAINYEVENGVVTQCTFAGGCPGNTQGVAKLVIGRKVEELIPLLKGIQCRGGTSCPDQRADDAPDDTRADFDPAVVVVVAVVALVAMVAVARRLRTMRGLACLGAATRSIAKTES